VSARSARPAGVTIDAAGTLIHTIRPVGELYATVAARHGVDVDPDALHTRFRAAFGAAPPLAFPDAPPATLRQREREWWRAVVRQVFAGESFTDFDAFFSDLFAFFARPATWRADPDAHRLLRELRGRRLVILVVSNFDARVRALLEALALTPLIDGITLSSEAGAAKPDPAIFHRALADARLDPTQVVHVGDTVREDLQGAHAAGLRVILVGGLELARAAPNAVVVPRLADVIGRIDDAR
jgi:putative hydrolase of the HAD superfamily